jgi:hypothetical protein
MWLMTGGPFHPCLTAAVKGDHFTHSLGFCYAIRTANRDVGCNVRWIAVVETTADPAAAPQGGPFHPGNMIGCAAESGWRGPFHPSRLRRLTAVVRELERAELRVCWGVFGFRRLQLRSLTGDIRLGPSSGMHEAFS